MTQYLCHECHLNLTAIFYERYKAAMKKVYPTIKSFRDDMKEKGATSTKATIKKVGTTIKCPRCHTDNEIVLDTMDKIEEMVMEMNR